MTTTILTPEAFDPADACITSTPIAATSAYSAFYFASEGELGDFLGQLAGPFTVFDLDRETGGWVERPPSAGGPAEIEAYRARTAELLAEYDARLAAVVDADHEAAKAEMAADAERRAEYKAYLCSMIDHGCDCLALDFDRWAQVVIADQLRTHLQRVADHARDAVRRQPYPDRHVYALGWLASAVRLNSQAEARATADGVEQGIAARVPL